MKYPQSSTDFILTSNGGYGYGYGFRRIQMTRLLLVICICLLQACASLGGAKGTPYIGLTEIKPDTGQVYIYRPSSFFMSLAIPTITINGDVSVGVRNGSYIIYELPRGNHKFSITNNDNWVAGNIDFDVDIQEHTRAFYRLSASLADIESYGQFVMISVSGHLVRVTEGFAESEMKNLKLTGTWP